MKISGIEYARKIFKSGNAVDHIHYPHLIHGFVTMTALRASKEASLDLINAYKTYFKKRDIINKECTF